jgi:O-antigen/teichoic acid export membrane protein
MQNRIIFKIISTGLLFLMSIVIGILVPRAIGPASYGDFSYIVATYAFLFHFFILTTRVAYIYFLSNDKHKIEDINTFYMLFLSIISVLVVIVWFVSVNNEFGIKYLWNGLEDKQLLFLGLVLVIFSTFQSILIQYSDSTSQTVRAEKIKLISKFLLVLSVLTFIFFDALNVSLFFILSIANVTMFLLLYIKYINFKFSNLNIKKFKCIYDDFYIYLKPLIIFSLIATIYDYFGKYVLQSSSGSVEQGYFNFALQLSLIPVIFISSLMAIYISETTKKFKDDDIESVRDIFLNNIFKTYAIHTFISLFMMINAKEIILLTVGESFTGAIGALQVLSIFSLLHTFGMLSGNLFFSSGRNKQYSVINSIPMILGIVCMMYFLFYGSLNSRSLALLMAFFYMIRVSIQLYINLIYLSIRKVRFIIELFLVTLIVYSSLKIINIMNFNLLINLIFSVAILLVVNFIFKDYIKLKMLRESITKMIS